MVINCMFSRFNVVQLVLGLWPSVPFHLKAKEKFEDLGRFAAQAIITVAWTTTRNSTQLDQHKQRQILIRRLPAEEEYFGRIFTVSASQIAIGLVDAVGFFKYCVWAEGLNYRWAFQLNFFN